MFPFIIPYEIYEEIYNEASGNIIYYFINKTELIIIRGFTT